MAVRQYIGARYVPKFSDINGGVWDNSYTYEALEIVRHGNDYYTSKIPVPTGVEITDSRYWVVTGNYSGAVQDLYDKVNALEERVKRPNAERKYIIIGDSYGGGYSPDTDARNGWMNYFINDNALTLGVNVFKSSVTGVGNSKFSLPDTELAFVEHLREIITVQLPKFNVNPLDITDIIVLGGTNDKTYTTNDIIAGMSAFFALQKQYCPNATVKVGVLSGSTSLSYDDQNNFMKVVGAYQRCGEYGGSYVTNSEFICAKKSLFSIDGTHPTQDGYRQISRFTSSLAYASSVDVFYTEYNTDMITQSGTWNRRAITANVRLHNETVSIFFNNTTGYVQFDYSEPLTLATVSHIVGYDLGTLNCDLVKAVGAGSIFGCNQIVALNSNGRIPNGMGTIYLENGNIKARVAVNIADSTSRTYSQLLIQPTLTFPTLQVCY